MRLQLRRSLLELRAPVAIRLGNRSKDLREAGHSLAILRRVVRAAVERLAVRREEDRHRPAAVSGHGLNGVHIDRVQIRTLLAVNLDVHERVIHQCRDIRVLERFVLHHMAPVAC